MGTSPCDVSGEILNRLLSASEELRKQAELAKLGSRVAYAEAVEVYRKFDAFTDALIGLDKGTINPDEVLRYVTIKDQISLYVLTTDHWEAIFKKSKKDPVYRAVTFYYVR
jgi:hypothetical protein